MSRIDEALNRASGRVGKTSELNRHSSGASPMDKYPTETPQPEGLNRASGGVAKTSELKRHSYVAVPIEKYPTETPPDWPREANRVSGGDPRRVQLETWQPPSESVPRLVSSTGDFVGVEQYRRLAAALHDAQTTQGLKVVTITSALPQDGKTLTAVNLALTLSESYSRRVLIIDADLRRPAVHKVLGIRNNAGLNEVLYGEVQELPLVTVSSTLSVLTSGGSRSTPLAGLASERMGTLLDECASRFDWVLIDVPPVGLLADAQILGRLTGAVILVIRAGATPHAVVERAISQIGRDSIIGTVLNAVEDSGTSMNAYYGAYQDHQK
jgi:protein-tyrosine kinase